MPHQMPTYLPGFIRGVIQVFVAIEIARGNPPGSDILRQMKLGEFINDIQLVVTGLRRHLIAKADALVVNSDAKIDGARRWRSRFEPYHHFIVVVSHEAAFAPWLLPGCV